MQITSATYRKNNFSTWLFGVTLLLGVSVFSGYTGKSATRYQHPVQTAWHYTNYNKNAPPAVSYKKAAVTLYQTNAIQNASAYKVALIVYNKRIQIKLCKSRKIVNSITFTHRFAGMPFIPGNADDDPLVSIAG